MRLSWLLAIAIGSPAARGADVECHLDPGLYNAASFTSDDFPTAIIAPLCGRNRGAFALDPPDGHTYSCVVFPKTDGDWGGAKIVDANAIKTSYVGATCAIYTTPHGTTLAAPRRTAPHYTTPHHAVQHTTRYDAGDITADEAITVRGSVSLTRYPPSPSVLPLPARSARRSHAAARKIRIAAGPHQPSTIDHRPSTIDHRPSTIDSKQPLVLRSWTPL